jgi:hypothetical protein
MKKMLPTLILLAVLIACNNEAKKDAQPGNVQVKSVSKPVDPLTAKMEDLKKTGQIDLNELGNYLPGELNGMKRSNFSMSSNLGYAVAQADYEKNRKTAMHITMIDCAGEAGANLYQSSYAAKLDKASGTEENFTKTIDINGLKAIETFEKDQNASGLSFMANDKVLVVMNGRNVSLEELKKAAMQLKK